MRAGGASSNAIAFTRWYYPFSEGDSAFIDRLVKPRFGVISIAQIELPGRANTNWIYIFVNGMTGGDKSRRSIHNEVAVDEKRRIPGDQESASERRRVPRRGSCRRVRPAQRRAAVHDCCTYRRWLSRMRARRDSVYRFRLWAARFSERHGHERRSSLSIFRRSLQVVVELAAETANRLLF
jgi:hypothetical protein